MRDAEAPLQSHTYVLWRRLRFLAVEFSRLELRVMEGQQLEASKRASDRAANRRVANMQYSTGLFLHHVLENM